MPIRRYKCKNVAGGCEHAFVKDIIEVATESNSNVLQLGVCEVRSGHRQGEGIRLFL